MVNKSRPPFDIVKATFYLVAFVIGVHALVVLGGMGACLWNAEAILSSPTNYCDPQGRLSELLAAALAAVLAFTGGRMRNKDDK